MVSDYFDTGEDPRFVFAESYLRMILDRLRGKKVVGLRREELEETLKDMMSAIRELRWSYLPKNELVSSEAFQRLEELANKLMFLLDEKGRELKVRDPFFHAELVYIGHVTGGLRSRIQDLPDKPVSAIDVVFVKVNDVEKHPSAKNLNVAYVTDGSKNYRVVTNDLTVRSGEIIPLALLPPRELMGVVSEGMFVGGREGIRRVKDEDVVGKRVDLTDEEEKAVLKEIFVFLKK